MGKNKINFCKIKQNKIYLATAPTYLVTDTPATLKMAIVTTPIIT